MGLFKRLAGLLGLAKEEEHQHQQQQDDVASPSTSPAAAPVHHGPRKGFSVPVQVPVDRAPPPPPLLVTCAAADGGIQGFRWYATRLRIDEDGDIADEFFDEVAPHTSASMVEQNRCLPRFEVKYNTRPVKVRNQALLPNGRIIQEVECSQGKLEWV